MERPVFLGPTHEAQVVVHVEIIWLYGSFAPIIKEINSFSAATKEIDVDQKAKQRYLKKYSKNPQAVK